MTTKTFEGFKIGFTPVIRRMVLSTVASCIISVSAGMMFGVTAVLLPRLRQDVHFDYDGSMDSWIASSANLSMILGGILIGPILDSYGRKLALILIGIPYTIGWICIALARTTILIIIGRVITGISTGAHIPVVLVYIGEIVDPKYRTIALALPLSLLHFGVLIIHLIGSYYSWRLTAMISIFPPVIASIGSCFLRESPLWLISKGRTEEGTVSFRWFRGTEEAAEAELNAVLLRPVDVKKSTLRDVFNVLCARSFLKPLLITVLLVANNQLSGITVLYYYAQDIFEGTLSGEVDPFTMMMIFSTAAGCIISLSAGMMYGMTAVMLPMMRLDEQFHYDGSEDSWIASSANLSMILGGIIAGPILDTYGRKLALILIGIPYTIGWICIASARTTVLVIIGRVITGISSGAHLPVVLVYIGEIIDPKYRTIALTFPLSMLHFGVLIIHLIGSYCSWRITVITCIFPPIVSSIGSCFLKESPLWLISKGRTEEGTVSFRWFRGTKEAAEAELNAVLQRPVDDKKSTLRDAMHLVCTHAFLKPFLITVLIVANIQFSGITVLYFYAKDVFEGTFSGEIDPFIMMMTTDCIRGSLALLVCCFGKILPKKITFLVSSTGLALFLYILVIYLFMYKEYGHVWVPVVCLVFYMGLSGLLVPIGQSFVPEVLPSNARGFGSGMTSAISYLFQFIVVKVSPDIMKNYNAGTMYACFATFSIVCGLFLTFLLPETRGKTLQSIEDNFNKNIEKEDTAL